MEQAENIETECTHLHGGGKGPGPTAGHAGQTGAVQELCKELGLVMQQRRQSMAGTAGTEALRGRVDLATNKVLEAYDDENRAFYAISWTLFAAFFLPVTSIQSCSQHIAFQPGVSKSVLHNPAVIVKVDAVSPI